MSAVSLPPNTITCPRCNNPIEARASNTEKNPGRVFFGCKGDETGGTCQGKGYFCWQDEYDPEHPIKPWPTVKRQRTTISQLPRMGHVTSDDLLAAQILLIGDSIQELKELHLSMTSQMENMRKRSEAHEAKFDALVSILRQTMSQDHPPQPSPSVETHDQVRPSHSASSASSLAPLPQLSADEKLARIQSAKKSLMNWPS